jgi:alkanesulfonate monooxygenase SsuD/methylene tetrahydromethanopterin reductase-like flavin-dependent oxidoreductase (luciferase family)
MSVLLDIMDVSYFLVTQFDSDHPLDNVPEDLVDQTKLIDESEFNTLFLGEHHATDDVYFLNEAVIAYLANYINDTRIGTGMCLLPYHNPVRIAEFGATVDHLTDGQFRLGVAQGYREEEYDIFGVPTEEALARFVEGVQVIERLWTEDSVSYDGKVHSFEDVSINPKPVQKPRPEIIAGASNESSVRRAAKLTDGWIGAHVPFDIFVEQAEAYREANAEMTEDGQAGLAREVFVAETTEQAESVVREPLMRKYSSYSDWGQDDVIESDSFDSTWEKLKHERFLIGTPAQVIEDINRYQSEADIDELWVRMQFPSIAVEDTKRSLELFIDEVLPEIN